MDRIFSVITKSGVSCPTVMCDIFFSLREAAAKRFQGERASRAKLGGCAQPHQTSRSESPGFWEGAPVLQCRRVPPHPQELPLRAFFLGSRILSHCLAKTNPLGGLPLIKNFKCRGVWEEVSWRPSSSDLFLMLAPGNTEMPSLQLPLNPPKRTPPYSHRSLPPHQDIPQSSWTL